MLHGDWLVITRCSRMKGPVGDGRMDAAAWRPGKNQVVGVPVEFAGALVEVIVTPRVLWNILEVRPVPIGGIGGLAQELEQTVGALGVMAGIPVKGGESVIHSGHLRLSVIDLSGSISSDGPKEEPSGGAEGEQNDVSEYPHKRSPLLHLPIANRGIGSGRAGGINVVAVRVVFTRELVNIYATPGVLGDVFDIRAVPTGGVARLDD